MDERARRPVLEPRHGAGAAEGRRIGHRLRRDEAVAEILLERRAETLAIGPLDEAHRAPAARTQRAVPVGRGAAGKAGRRIKRVERRARQAQGERASARAPRRPRACSASSAGKAFHATQVSANRALRERRSGA